MSKSGRGDASIKKGRVFVLANFKLPFFKLYHHLRSNPFRNLDSSSGLIRDPTFRAPLPSCIMYSTSLTINIKCFDRSPAKSINDSRTSSDCMAECELVGWGLTAIASSCADIFFCLPNYVQLSFKSFSYFSRQHQIHFLQLPHLLTTEN